MPPDPELDFIHRYDPPAAGERRTLLLLHGTGGDERDIASLGEMLAPEYGRLAPRGRVLEGTANRFFRRLAEGVFDVDDLKARAAEMARFVLSASAHYGVDRAAMTAVGYSNGANIASAMLLVAPGTFPAAVLLRPMVPFVPAEPVDLSGHRVLALFGAADPLSPPGEQERLTALLGEAGADVDCRTVPAGHGLIAADLDIAREWLGDRQATDRHR